MMGQSMKFEVRNGIEWCNMYYFAYGSNLNLHQMHFRCRDARKVTSGVASDTQLVFRRVADIEHHQGSQVAGALYRVSRSDIAALDRYEGYPTLYSRKTIHVHGDDMREYVAFVYVMNHQTTYDMPDYGYYQIIMDGYRDWKLDVQCLKDAMEHTMYKVYMPEEDVAQEG